MEDLFDVIKDVKNLFSASARVFSRLGARVSKWFE